ncbi:MAG: hypothetical protein ACK56I_20050, partial [bacterium]
PQGVPGEKPGGGLLLKGWVPLRCKGVAGGSRPIGGHTEGHLLVSAEQRVHKHPERLEIIRIKNPVKGTPAIARPLRLEMDFVDAAEAMRKGMKPDALRRAALDALAARAEASTVVIAAPLPAVPGDSP